MTLSDWKQFFGHMWPRPPHYTPADYPDLNQKVFIVTGGSSGIGFHTTRYLLQSNATVYMVGRDEENMSRASIALLTEMPNAKLHTFKCDFSDLRTIEPGVQRFLEQETQLDCVIHNAGVMAPKHNNKTPQGLDWQVGTNCVGPWLLQRYLDDILISTAARGGQGGRIIWVASSAHMYSSDDFDWETPQGSKQKIYGTSKAINIMQAILWGVKHPDANVINLSLHPGNVKSGLQRDMTGFSRFFRDSTFYEPHYGAFTELYAALHPKFNVKSHYNGAYVIPFGQCGQARQDLVDSAVSDRGKKLLAWLDKTTDEFFKRVP